ncbi:MAG: endonuclease/exonuclease/phosphatase family protein [Bdellovibrionales bacterium]|nr:endonuclease/exonuclease/phosphatase family protein [Bdellovibrionales bacterium]
MDDFRRYVRRCSTLITFVFAFSALSFIGLERAEAGLKVMNFNVMCRMCKKRKEYGKFKERLANIIDTVKRHDPDLISFQEVGTAGQLKKMNKMLGNRYEIFSHDRGLKWADPALFVKKERFTAANPGGVWLGKKLPKFSFGWGKLGIPRRFQWVFVKDRTNGQSFLFAGTHFDNHGANKAPASLYAAEFFKAAFRDAGIPVLFAGDSNLNPSMEGYANLKSTGMTDSFHDVSQVTYFSNKPYDPNDACGDEKGAVFPDCRIDHVMKSPGFPWRATSWGVDVFRYTKWNWWVSDHRAVIVNFE